MSQDAPNTIGDFIKPPPHSVGVNCANPACRHFARLDLYALAKRLGPSFPINQLRGRLACSKCGQRVIKFQHFRELGRPATFE
jgi:hypothetical protein